MKSTENPAFAEKICALADKHCFHLYDAVLMEGDSYARAVHTPANPCNNSYSVSKVFTMSAIGMLVEAGKLDVHDRVCDILAPVLETPPHESWREVEVHHALRHEMGLGSENLNLDIDLISDFGSRNYLHLAMGEKLPHAPGTHNRYSDTAYYILSRVVSAITGETVLDFLRPRLFHPLGFSEVAWSTCPMGFTIGATGLYVKTHDMAKIGLLYAQQGEYENQRVLSEDWVRFALENDYELHVNGACRGKGGMRGQFVAFHPETRRVLAWHAYEENNDAANAFTDEALRSILET